MKKPPSRRVRPNRLLVQLSTSIRCISHLATIAGEHCNGTAAFSVADGLVYGQCHARKRFVDFRTFLQTVVIAEAQRRRVKTVALVLDNGSTHAPKQLPGFTQELETTSEGKLIMQLYWLPTNARLFGSDRDLVRVCCNANSCSPTISAASMSYSKLF